MNYRKATYQDLSFIIDTYNANINALHGEIRDYRIWEKLLDKEGVEYFIVYSDTNLGWFRLDYSEVLELGMLQISPSHQREGVGRYIISVVEDIAKKKNYKEIIIHTTEDNVPAQKLYLSCGYELIEVGPCTTADGQERIGHTYKKEMQRI